MGLPVATAGARSPMKAACSTPRTALRAMRSVAAVAVLCATLVVTGADVSAGIETSAGCTANTATHGQEVPLGFTLADAVGGTHTSMYISSRAYVYASSTAGITALYGLFPIATLNTSPTTYGFTTVEGRNALCVTWTNIGTSAEMTNDAQVLVVDRSDIAVGDFDVIWKFGDMDYAQSAYVGWEHSGQDYRYEFLPGFHTVGAYNTGGAHDLTGKRVTATMRSGAPSALVVSDDVAPTPTNVIAFDTSLTATYGDADRSLTATASSGLVVSLAATGSCTLTGTTLDLGGSGTCTVTASQAGDGPYPAAADVVRVIEIAKATQTLTVTDVTAAQVGGTAVTIDAASDSGLAVTTNASGACILTGSELSFATAGTCALSLHQAGDANHAEASRDVTFTVAKGDAAVDVTGLARGYDGTPKAVTVTVDPADLTGVAVTYDGSANPPSAAGTYAVVVTLTNDDWAAAPVDATLVIGAADQTITVTAPDTATYGDGPVTYTATASSGLAVTATTTGPCSLAGDRMSILGTGTCTVTATQAGNGNYRAAAPVTVEIDVAAPKVTMRLVGLIQVEGEVTGVEVITDPPDVDIPVTVTYYGHRGAAISAQGVEGVEGEGTTAVPTEPGIYTVVASVDSDLWDVEDVTATFQILAAEVTPNPVPQTPTAPHTPAPAPASAPEPQTATAPPDAATPAAAPTGALPQTGTGIIALTGIGVLLAATGVSMRRAGQRPRG